MADELAPLRKAIQQWEPDIVFNLLEEFHGESVFDHNVVRTLPMRYFTSPKPPPIITGVPVPYPNFAGTPSNGQILFFDEADALFGKRTNVQSRRLP